MQHPCTKARKYNRTATISTESRNEASSAAATILESIGLNAEDKHNNDLYEKTMNQIKFLNGRCIWKLGEHLNGDLTIAEKRSNVNGSYMMSLIAFDLSKTVNNVNHRGLIIKLPGQFGFSKSSCKFVYSYLTGTSRFFDINGVYSTTCQVYAGVLQGSPPNCCHLRSQPTEIAQMDEHVPEYGWGRHPTSERQQAKITVVVRSGQPNIQRERWADGRLQNQKVLKGPVPRLFPLEISDARTEDVENNV
uniref:Uncharacterized protein n=1 Tax=Glossina palpalis gambiensis TaxID=67801 RepID=A0A1B0BZA5_9MUSC